MLNNALETGVRFVCSTFFGSKYWQFYGSLSLALLAKLPSVVLLLLASAQVATNEYGTHGTYWYVFIKENKIQYVTGTWTCQRALI